MLTTIIPSPGVYWTILYWLQACLRANNVEAYALSRAKSFVTPPDYHALASSQDQDAELKDILKIGLALQLKWVQIPWTGVNLYCDTSTTQPRPFVTTPFRRQVFDFLNGFSHPVDNTTVKMVSQRFVCPGVGKDCGAWVRACRLCQRSKITRHVKVLLGSFNFPSTCFSHWLRTIHN